MTVIMLCGRSIMMNGLKPELEKWEFFILERAVDLALNAIKMHTAGVKAGEAFDVWPAKRA